MIKLRLLGAIVLVALAGCGSGRGHEAEQELPGTSAPSVEALAGHTFVSASVDGRDLVDDTRITLTFTDETLSAAAGCNTMNGGYSIDDDTLQVATMTQTAMSCGDELDAQDQWLSTFLTAGPTASIAHDVLTLEHDGATIVLGDSEMKAI